MHGFKRNLIRQKKCTPSRLSPSSRDIDAIKIVIESLNEFLS